MGVAAGAGLTFFFRFEVCALASMQTKEVKNNMTPPNTASLFIKTYPQKPKVE